MTALPSPCAGCGGRFALSRRTLCVRSAADLDKLRYTFRRYDSISMVGTAVSEDERVVWERRLLAAYTECGCKAGGAALLVVFGMLMVLAPLVPSLRTWASAAVSVAACMVAALAGKVVGIAIGRVSLWQGLAQVRALLLNVQYKQDMKTGARNHVLFNRLRTSS